MSYILHIGSTTVCTYVFVMCIFLHRPIVYANMSTKPIKVSRAQSGFLFFKSDKVVSYFPHYHVSVVCADILKMLEIFISSVVLFQISVV